MIQVRVSEKMKQSKERREFGRKVNTLARRKILEVILETKDLTKELWGDG